MTPLLEEPAVRPLFPGVNPAKATALLAMLQPVRLADMDLLFTEGEPGDTLHIITSGVLSNRCETPGDELVELARVGAGEVVGELAVISPAPRSATALAIGPVTTLALPRSLLTSLLEERAPAAEALLRALTLRTCRRLRQTDARIAVLQDALRGASPLDLITRIEAVVLPAEAPPETGDGTWSSRLVTYLRREPG